MSKSIQAGEGRHLKGSLEPRGRICGAVKEAASFSRFPETKAQPLRAGKPTEPKGTAARRDRPGAHSPIKDQEPGSGKDGDSYRSALPLAGGPGWSGGGGRAGLACKYLGQCQGLRAGRPES